jgi:hypothetical protein
MRANAAAFLAILLLSSAAFVPAARAATVRFAGRDWIVAQGPCQSGNVCAPENVWVDGEGLHLRLSSTSSGGFRAASVESADYTRYGMHRFYVRGPVADLHKNVVLGLFTFKNRKDLRDNDFIDADLIAQGEGEIDIELTRWGNGAVTAANSYFTVQEGPPPPPAENASSATFKLSDCRGLDCYTTHYFDWGPDRIRFKSFRGHAPEPPQGPGWLIHQWEYPQPGQAGRAIPREALPKIVMNLYRDDARDVSAGQEVEVIITNADLPIEREPILSAGSARPYSGEPAAGVYLFVDYDDPDGDAPSVKLASIDGANHEMSLFSGSASSGTYRCGPVQTIGGGPGYYFTFADGHGGNARLPSSGRFVWGPAR